MPSALHVPFFEAILVNLGNFERYNAPGPDVDRRSRFEIIWTFLYALTRFDKTLIERNEALADMILKSWPIVLKWLRILTKDSSDDNVMTSTINKSRSQVIADLLYKLSSSSKTKHILWADEVIAFAFDFWARTDHDFRASSVSSFILSQCVSNVELSLPKLEEITGWDLHQTVVLVISRLRHAAAHIHEEVYLLQSTVTLLGVVLGKNHEHANDLCYNLDAIGSLLSLIRSSLRHRKDMPPPTLVKHVDLANTCFCMIQNILEDRPGSECTEAINTALRDGLMETLLQTSPYASGRLGSDVGSDESFPIMFLREYLPRLLVFTSCIRNSTKATQKLGFSSLEAISRGHAAFRRAWRSLQRLLSYRVASVTFFALKKPFYRCSNVCRSFLTISTGADTSTDAV